MPWVRIDDAFADHPKTVQAGGRAAWLDVAAMCYASRYLTDGFIPAKQVPRLTDEPNPDELAQALVDAGLWERRPGGFLIHDYLDYNPSAAAVRAQRRADLERKARGNSARIPAGIQPESERIPTVPVPIPGQKEEIEEEIPELDDTTASKAAAFKSAAGRPASTKELDQLAQLDATPAEISQAVQIAADHKARYLWPYAKRVLADWQAGQQATDQARKRQPAPAPRPAPEPDPLADMWAATLSELKLQMTWATFNTWIRETRAVKRFDHTIEIETPNSRAKEWIDGRLRTLIERTLSGIAEEEMHLLVTTKEVTPCQN